MTTPILHLIRGLPGSGKSTYANTLGCIVISPSDFMSRCGGEYKWIRENYMVSKMHFREIVRSIMALQIDIAITEIMPEEKFIKFWLEIAVDYYYKVQIKNLYCTPEESINRNVHGADHKSIYEIHEQFDYTIIDQTIDYSNVGRSMIINYGMNRLPTNEKTGCAIRAWLDGKYPQCKTYQEKY